LLSFFNDNDEWRANGKLATAGEKIDEKRRRVAHTMDGWNEYGGLWPRPMLQKSRAALPIPISILVHLAVGFCNAFGQKKQNDSTKSSQNLHLN